MIEQLLPTGVAAVESRHDDLAVKLFPEEEALVANAVEKRRREFTAARACARAALGRIGIAAVPILSGERGEPLWPQGVVGSITHCDGYRACAVARSSEVLTLGIDAEPNGALPEGLLADIARPEELPGLRTLSAEYADVHWDRLLFSAKESVYKAWFPLAKRWLGFEDARITFDPSSRVFTARLLVSGPVVAGTPLTGFSGTWMVSDGLIVTAIAVSAV
ncbi:MAG TPA: 4'-phosphopantetheinyl transferase superfamily protein [Solirubrobacteraceae bacterium]|nr:4'-phosphopantetheinyl transferase superfamily protein [Solirubrobacteraceae bacterium]